MTPVEKATLAGLSKGIQAELAAYVFYKRALAVCIDDKVKLLLSWLAEEERTHYFALEQQYDSLVRSEMWVTVNDALRQGGLPDIDWEMQEIHEDFLEEVDEKITPKRILEIGLTLEKRACALYAGLADVTDDPAGKETYQFLSRFEQGHVTKIESAMKELGYA
ncbi:MAG: ferritin family protein [candidate division Zixibacteria bacterium]|nr:ferritin family protein [candidate division Zixibacteria bacterium]